MDANYAAQTQSFTLADGAYLEFLPDPVIPHRRSRFISDTRMVVAPTATLLYAEVLHCGRKHHHRDEAFGFTVYDARIAATRPDGAGLFAERLLIEPARRDPRDTGVMGPFDVLGNAVLLTPQEHADRMLAALPAGIDAAAGLAFGACRLPNDAGVIYKVLGLESAPVRARLREFWSLARQTVLGVAAPAIESWR
jgi:urease accessory protein